MNEADFDLLDGVPSLEARLRALQAELERVVIDNHLLREENEAVAQAFGEQESGFQVLPAAQALAPLKLADPDALCSGDFLRLWPHRHATDGFFAAVWVRK